MDRPFNTLLGLVLTSVHVGKENILFKTVDGRQFEMLHCQECCEQVQVEDVVGDINDLIGVPITMAEEVTGETPADQEDRLYDESYTWTFYKLATVKGYVDIRWLGESNGYYSEKVSFREI